MPVPSYSVRLCSRWKITKIWSVNCGSNPMPLSAILMSTAGAGCGRFFAVGEFRRDGDDRVDIRLADLDGIFDQVLEQLAHPHGVGFDLFVLQAMTGAGDLASATHDPCSHLTETSSAALKTEFANCSSICDVAGAELLVAGQYGHAVPIPKHAVQWNVEAGTAMRLGVTCPRAAAPGLVVKFKGKQDDRSCTEPYGRSEAELERLPGPREKSGLCWRRIP